MDKSRKKNLITVALLAVGAVVAITGTYLVLTRKKTPYEIMKENYS